MPTIKGRRTWVEKPAIPTQTHYVNFKMVTGHGLINCQSFYGSSNGITATSTESSSGVSLICDLTQADGGWGGSNYIACRTIDFGDEEQEISQETFDYLVANTMEHTKILKGTWKIKDDLTLLAPMSEGMAHYIEFESNATEFKFMQYWGDDTNWYLKYNSDEKTLGGSSAQVQVLYYGNGSFSYSANYMTVVFKDEQSVLESVYNWWTTYAEDISPDITPFYEYKNGEFKKITMYQCINGEIIRVSKGE